jgi:hypothetical protein
MIPSFPGKTGALDHSGVVQPQEARTFVITIGAFPTFVNLKTCVAKSPSTTLPKSWELVSNWNFPCEKTAKVQNRRNKVEVIFFISVEF